MTMMTMTMIIMMQDKVCSNALYIVAATDWGMAAVFINMYFLSVHKWFFSADQCKCSQVQTMTHII